jgi:hypothetical protein
MSRATTRRRAEADILRAAAGVAAGRLPGFEPPSARAILEQAAATPLRGGDAPLSGGLFDPGNGKQWEFFR